MVTNLMDQYMADDVADRATSGAPMLDDRPAIEEDDVDVLNDRVRHLSSDMDASIETQKVDRVSDLHCPEGRIVRQFVDPQTYTLDMPSETRQGFGPARPQRLRLDHHVRVRR